MAYPSNSETVAQAQLRAFVERILRMKEEAKAINDDIREIYAEAKGNGFDKTVLGQLVGYVEKRAKDPAAHAERGALFDLYLSAYDETGTPVATHAHEAIEHDADGVITEPTEPLVPVVAPEGAADALSPSGVIPSGAAEGQGDDVRETEGVDRPEPPQPDTTPPQPSRHNPATHFKNSQGLPRLHGCQNPDACAGSWRELCHGCRRIAEAA